MHRNHIMPCMLSVLFVLLSQVPSIVDAKGGKGGGGSSSHGGGKVDDNHDSSADIDVTLHLSSVPAAAFSFFVIFAVITLYQLYRGVLEFTSWRKKDEDFDKRIPFMWCIFLGTLSLLVEYILGTVIYAQLGSSLHLSTGVTSAFTLTQEIGTEFIYAGLLFLLACRGSIETSLGTYRLLGGSTNTSGPEHIIAGILLLVMLASTIARAVMSAVITKNITDMVYAAYDTLRHFYVGILCILTLMISLWSSLLWRHSKPSALTHDLVHFDTYVLHRIVTLISPALGIRALYEVIRDIIITHTTFYNGVSILGLNLATLLIQGIVSIFVIHIAHTLGRINLSDKDPKSSSVNFSMEIGD